MAETTWDRNLEIVEEAGKALIGEEVIRDLWQRIDPRRIEEDRFITAICRWAGISANSIEEARAEPSLRDQREALTAFSIALRKTVKAWNDLSYAAQVKVLLDCKKMLTPSDSDGSAISLAETSEFLHDSLEDRLEFIARRCEVLADRMRVPGRPREHDKRQAIAELILIWRWATGQDRLGDRFDKFGHQALSTLYRWPTDDGVKNWVGDYKAVSAAISKNPRRPRLCYLP